MLVLPQAVVGLLALRRSKTLSQSIFYFAEYAKRDRNLNREFYICSMKEAFCTSTIIQIGTNHINHCEDYLLYEEVGDLIIAAVMDGCTNARESYFASALIGKLIRKGLKEISYLDFVQKRSRSVASWMYQLMFELVSHLKVTKNFMHFDKYDVLSTLILFVYSKGKKNGLILNVGDGVIAINGKIIEFEQNNTPDYLAYHLDKDFDEWFNKNSFTTVSKLQDISISTDGIFSFKSTNITQDIVNPVDFLLVDTSIMGNDLLYLKYKKLRHTFYLEPYDDLAIIRIINA